MPVQITKIPRDKKRATPLGNTKIERKKARGIRLTGQAGKAQRAIEERNKKMKNI